MTPKPMQCCLGPDGRLTALNMSKCNLLITIREQGRMSSSVFADFLCRFQGLIFVKEGINMKQRSTIFLRVLLMMALMGCGSPKSEFTGAPGEVKLITLDPGHFHAALVQK